MMNHSTPKATSPLAMWLSYLENIHSSAIDLGLERVSTVSNAMQLNKPAPTVITVAGTNGKGSTCAIMESILLEAGYKVGVYSSPHLIDYKERVRINGQLLTDQDFTQVFSQIEQARDKISLSFFEFGTLAALQLCKQNQVDVLLLEVGLGGRLDATNIVEHNVSVITSLAIDHVDWLGDDIEVIGYEKAGIFRSLKPAICGQPFPPLSVEEHADNINAQLFQVGKDFDYQISTTHWQWQCKYLNLDNLPIPNLPIANAATSLMALSTSGLEITKENIVDGLKKAQLAGRMQQVSQSPVIIFDVAHNPHSAEYLANYLTEHYPNYIIHGVVGMLKDKDIKQTLNKLEGIVDKWYPADLFGDRAATAKELIAYLPNTTLNSKQGYTCPVKAFEAAEKQLNDNLMELKNKQIPQSKFEEMIVVLGSFHTVGEVMADWTKKGKN